MMQYISRYWNRVLELHARTKFLALIIATALVWYALCLPDPLFDSRYSTVLESRNGRLLSATIADDGQWRFPERDSVPEKFAAAIVAFEDKRFYYHPGVDPISMTRALYQNIREGKVVSGGSTLTMQVIRLSRRSEGRTLLEKFIEVVLATRLELAYSKEEILALYASHAPFGGNVVGLDAACWRYFGREPESLSWAESAMLAVLPNAPSLVHPGKNRDALRVKRDLLLDRLRQYGRIDSLTCALAKLEPVPESPQPLPRYARHLLARMKKEGMTGKRLTSTIDEGLQQRVEQRLQEHHERLVSNRIYNGAVLVLDVKTGEALAYAGNVGPGDGQRGEEVDVIMAPRSTGSILKPLLFAASIDEGLILPGTLLPDIPVLMNGFSPQNFSKEYDGAVPASEALIRSLNVPSVFLLKDYRYDKFQTLLRNVGMTTLNRSPDHYGLSLILGGAEGTLWEVTGVYASMARTLRSYFEHPGTARYTRSDFHAPSYYKRESKTRSERTQTSWLSASGIYLTFETLKELYRPSEEAGWRHFHASRNIAWKTGTSFGFRDGWAVGVNGDFAVGVWIGNADGEGRAGLTGINTAAPLMFDVFSLLRGRTWFDPPQSELQRIAVCRKSGQRYSPNCENADTIWVSHSGLSTPACRYHKTLHVSKDRRYQLHSGCANLSDVDHVKWFVLPPVQEYYFRSRNISYRAAPPFRHDCQAPGVIRPMDFIYPEANAKIWIPRDFDGTAGRSVFELAHRDQNTSVFWHLDGVFIGSTKGVHKLALSPGEGNHVLTVVDENGNSLEGRFAVISGL
jgi:penicillin-binding protein 1C